MQFTWWEVALLCLVLYWPVTLLVTVVLAVIGFTSKGRTRAVCLTLAAIPAVTAVAVGLFLLSSHIQEKQNQRLGDISYAKRHYRLTAPTTVAGLTLPAGTVITWRDDDKTYLDEFYLPQPAPVLGATLQGYGKHDSDNFYKVQLATDEVVAGWPCKAGDVTLNPQGDVWNCVLSRDTTVPSPTGAGPLHFPAGTRLELSPGSDTGHTFTSPDGTTVSLPDIGERVPAGNVVRLYRNGGERGVYSSQDTPFSVRGVPYMAEVRFIYDPDPDEDSNGPTTPPVATWGEPAASMQCDGTLFARGALSFVRVNLRENTVEFVQLSEASDSEKRSPPIPAALCKPVQDPEPPAQ